MFPMIPCDRYESRPRLKDAFPDAFTGSGLFAAMENPVWENAFTAAELDVYFITTYGNRIAAPYLRHFIGDDVDDLTDLTQEQIEQIAAFIQSLYKSNWEHLWNAYTAEYNPIHNYDSMEQETMDRDTGRNATTSAQNTGSRNSSGSTSGNVFGFNSSSASPATSGTDSVQETTGNTGSGTEVETGTEDYTRTLNRSGNIGVTTNAQMIAGEIDLWKWLFMGTVMEDICRVLALSIY